MYWVYITITYLKCTTRQHVEQIKKTSNPGTEMFLKYTFSSPCLTFFSESTGLCNLKIAIYSFPAPCWDLARRVARSTHTIRHPETLKCKQNVEWQNVREKHDCSHLQNSMMLSLANVTAIVIKLVISTREMRRKMTKNYLGIEGSRVACFVATEDVLNPSHNLMGWRVGRLIKIEETGRNISLDISLQRRASFHKWGVMAGSHVHFVEILKIKTSNIHLIHLSLFM